MILGRRTPVTTLLLASIAVGFGLQVFLGDAFTNQGANYGPAVFQGGEWWRLVTSMFLHGRDRPPAAQRLGSLPARALSSRPGSARRGCSWSTSPAVLPAPWRALSLPEVPSVGASGAIFGVMGALIAFLLRRRQLLLPRRSRSSSSSWAGRSSTSSSASRPRASTTPPTSGAARPGSCSGWPWGTGPDTSPSTGPARAGRGILRGGCNGLIQ